MKRCSALILAALAAFWGAPGHGYSFNEIVPDVRQPIALSGGSACPVRSHQLTSSSSIALRWSTVLGFSPLTILTQNQTAAGRPTEIEQVISQSLAVWTGVTGTTLRPASLAPLSRVATASACGSDGVISICFDQPDVAFTPGVLAFTRVITADAIGVQIGTGAAATQVGQILDADVYFNPGDSQATFATPLALASSPRVYDLESILTHELGHALGFSHSAVWNAMMYPYAPAPGTFVGPRPTALQPDAPLGEDDRTGLRALYPDPADTLHVGSIGGHVLPANPLSLTASSAGVSGIFGAHVVAVDSATGAVIGGTLGGWSCAAPGPPQFNGAYQLERLPVGRSYVVYVEPLDGTVAPSQVTNALASLCRNPTTDAGWPPLQGCIVPAINTGFTVRMR